MAEQALNEPGLSKDPRLSELFEFIKVDKGVRVLPVTVQQSEDDTRLMIVIQGKHETASVIMAQLMTQIQDMHDLSDQQAAADDGNEPESQIIVPGSTA